MLHIVIAAFKAVLFATISLWQSVSGFCFNITTSASVNFKAAFCLCPFSEFSKGVNSH